MSSLICTVSYGRVSKTFLWNLSVSGNGHKKTQIKFAWIYICVSKCLHLRNTFYEERITRGDKRIHKSNLVQRLSLFRVPSLSAEYLKLDCWLASLGAEGVQACCVDGRSRFRQIFFLKIRFLCFVKIRFLCRGHIWMGSGCLHMPMWTDAMYRTARYNCQCWSNQDHLFVNIPKNFHQHHYQSIWFWLLTLEFEQPMAISFLVQELCSAGLPIYI